jgi:hypothetical protein
MHSYVDENGELTFYPGADAPLMDRIAVRHMLLDELPDETVKWGAKVVSITPSSTLTNEYDITFASGAIETGFDLVVGADGAWSKVRGLLTDSKPFYSGLSYIETEIKDLSHAPKEITDLVKRGSYYNQGNGSSIVAQRKGDNI